MIYCGISSRSHNTQVEQDHAPRPPSARRIAGALIYACGDSRFSVHLHSSAARLLGSPCPRQREEYYQPNISVEKMKSMCSPHLSTATTSLVLPASTFKCPACVRRLRMGNSDRPCFGSGIILYESRSCRGVRAPSAHNVHRCSSCSPAQSSSPNHGAVQLPEDVSSTCLRLPTASLYPPPSGNRSKNLTSTSDFQNKIYQIMYLKRVSWPGADMAEKHERKQFSASWL